mmetsp:Transcript_62322/g.190449  ORF Transcript_62322/g.190449 Transcript_62322/m.190449 type:complete len:208 (-) Transcript_62322:1724-2347(-)
MHRAALPFLLRAAADEHNLQDQFEYGRCRLWRILLDQRLPRGDRQVGVVEARVVRRHVPRHGREGPARPGPRLQALRRERRRGQSLGAEAAGRKRKRDDLRRFHFLQVRDAEGFHARDQGAPGLQTQGRDAHRRRSPDRVERGPGGRNLRVPFHGGVGPAGKGRHGATRVGARNHHGRRQEGFTVLRPRWHHRLACLPRLGHDWPRP